jgi:hypothetical protein
MVGDGEAAGMARAPWSVPGMSLVMASGCAAVADDVGTEASIIAAKTAPAMTRRTVETTMRRVPVVMSTKMSFPRLTVCLINVGSGTGDSSGCSTKVL